MVVRRWGTLAPNQYSRRGIVHSEHCALDQVTGLFHVPRKTGECFESAKSVFGARDDAVSRWLTYGFGNGTDGKSAHGALRTHAGPDKRHLSLGSRRVVALRVKRSFRIEGNVWAPGLRNGRKLVIYNACGLLEHRGADPDTRTATIGSALARNDRLCWAFIAHASDDSRDRIAACRLFTQ